MFDIVRTTETDYQSGEEYDVFSVPNKYKLSPEFLSEDAAKFFAAQLEEQVSAYKNKARQMNAFALYAARDF